MVHKIFRYIEPFRCRLPVWQTDGRTAERWTDRQNYDSNSVDACQVKLRRAGMNAAGNTLCRVHGVRHASLTTTNLSCAYARICKHTAHKRRVMCAQKAWRPSSHNIWRILLIVGTSSWKYVRRPLKCYLSTMHILYTKTHQYGTVLFVVRNSMCQNYLSLLWGATLMPHRGRAMYWDKTK